jgi:VanZ family protein
MHQNNTLFSPLKYWKSIIWAIIIAIGLFTSGDKLPKHRFFDFEQMDKVLHLLIFGFLQFLILFDIYQNNVIITRKHIIFSLVISIGYGILTEIIQYVLISKREGSIFDLFADITGIMLSMAFFFLIQKSINRFFLRKS